MSHDDHGDWFRHESEEGLPQAEHGSHVSSVGLGMTFLIIVFGVLFVILLLTAYFGMYTTGLQSQRQEGTDAMAEYLSYRAGAFSKLDTLGWENRDAETAHVPLDRAKQAVVEYYAQPGRVGLADWDGPTRLQPVNTAVLPSEDR